MIDYVVMDLIKKKLEEDENVPLLVVIGHSVIVLDVEASAQGYSDDCHLQNYQGSKLL